MRDRFYIGPQTAPSGLGFDICISVAQVVNHWLLTLIGLVVPLWRTIHHQSLLRWHSVNPI
jgi:hypothetical protein